MKKRDIMLSIIVTTYNHENYIEKAINSIIMQKVNFEYEVLIGEDCSTDNTRQVLKAIENKVDDRFKFYYREENYNSNPNKYPYGNGGDLKLKSKGKYMIMLEGDDYWLDENKLQRQIDFLESNKDYYAIGHNCIMVDEFGNKHKHLKYPILKKSDYNIKKLAFSFLPGQTASFLYRNPFLETDEIDNDFLLNTSYGVGDRRNFFYCSTRGKIKIWYKEFMSAYRYVTTGGSSFSANIRKYDREKNYKHIYSYFYYCDRKNIVDVNRRVAELLYFKTLVINRIKKRIDKAEFKKIIKKFLYKKYCYFTFLKVVLYEKLVLRKRMFKSRF